MRGSAASACPRTKCVLYHYAIEIGSLQLINDMIVMGWYHMPGAIDGWHLKDYTAVCGSISAIAWQDLR